MTNVIEPSVPQSETGHCPACGTWTCDDCGAQRPYTSRFSEKSQQCASCRSLSGQMMPSSHCESRADEHATSYQSRIANSGAPRYPLGLEL